MRVLFDTDVLISAIGRTKHDEDGRRETLMFNGYQDKVESMYEDMDLKEFY